MKKNKSFADTQSEICRLSGGKRERAERLFEKAVFMDEQMQFLQECLAKKGWVEEYQNGENQRGMKKSSEADVYIALSKNYMSIMKQLDELVSNAPVAAANDPLSEFI